MFYLFLADGFEEIEAVATIDILRRADIEISTIGVDKTQVTGSHGITITADFPDKYLNPLTREMDGVILPGGPGTESLLKSATVKQALEYCIKQNLIIAAICAAPSVPGSMGMFNGIRATCYPGFEDKLIDAIITDEPVVADNKFITAKGPGTAMDFALEIVRQVKGDALAKELRKEMQYESLVRGRGASGSSGTLVRECR